MRKVVIVGAGALGKCFAALLAKTAEVMMYERDLAIFRALKKDGLFLKEKGRTRKVKVSVVASLASLRGVDINGLIFATKVVDLPQAARQAGMLYPRWILLPQNGVFDIRPIRRYFKKAKVCRAVTTMACQQTGPNQVTLFYRGSVYAGGDGALLLADLFRQSGVRFRAYADSEGAVLAKLIFSAIMNPLPVITHRGYEVLKTDSYVWKLVHGAVKEGRMIARAAGVRLAFDPLKFILRVRQGDLAGIAHRGSFYQDMLAGRPTELEDITGALIRQARCKNIKTPALDSILRRAKSAGA